jgi:hypothetical protein
MQRSKEIFAIMREQLFNEINPEIRQQFTHVEVREADEWVNHKDDPVYIKLYNAEKKAKKEKQEYLFNLRHK